MTNIPNAAMNKLFTSLLFTFFFFFAKAQSTKAFADSVRKIYTIPELNYAVVSSTEILEMQALGTKKMGSKLQATLTDKFRIGSNTKTVTSYLATLLVKQGKIKWDTKFFDLYPELKASSNKAFHHFALQDFLTFRANMQSWSYGNDKPTPNEIKGTEQEQRYQFIRWILQQKEDTATKTIYWSNPSYVAAGLMLEKVTGKDYKTLVMEFGKTLGIRFGFGQPNFANANQTWGHTDSLVPEKPAQNYKLNWLSSAGNINVSLPDYVKFMQLHLQGLKGKNKILSAADYENMLFGLPEFAFGWEWYVDEESKFKYAMHTGNPGTFFTRIFICKDTDKAFIFFANVQSDNVEEGITVLFKELEKKYRK
jgi:CubicO group peptidase (beta-lactamase class C family)